MRKYISIVIVAILLVIIIFTLTGCNSQTVQKDETKFNIVTSFYPINIMLLNITEGANDVTLENMTDSQVGCLHEYTLKTQDLVKLENADVLIENGLGIENFTDKVVNMYPDLKIVDSSNGIKHGENPHIWTSTTNYIQQVKNITEELSKLDTDNAKLYKENAEKYINKILEIQQNLLNENSIKAITFNEEFEYFAEENNIELITIETQHEESALSAEKLADVIDKMKEENIKKILVNPSENTKNAQLISAETGAVMYEIEPYMVGEFDKDSYINVLTKNLETINQMKQS